MLMTIRARNVAAVALLHGMLAGSESALAQEPCCIVSAIDMRTATVTARERDGGRTLQFKVTNPAILRTLKVGQAVFADADFQNVAFSPGGQACCRMIDDDASASP